MSKTKQYITLILVYLFYASISVILKYTGLQEPLTLSWCMGFAGLILTLGIYAVVWQQILKHIDLGTAYMFKGVSLIFIMLLLYLCFGEPVTPMKMIGTGIIVVGIALYAKA
jgi:multidrug transporter EmrE-like cation transporter